VARPRGAPRAISEGETARQGYKIEKIRMEPETGVVVPAWAFIPPGGAARKPAVIYVNSAGKAADAGEGGAIEALVRAGKIVLAVDPRGWGEAGPSGGRSTNSRSYNLVMRALLVGKNLPGMQTEDLLSAFDYLAARGDVDPRHISIVGKDHGAVPALFAAVLEPRLEKVTCANAPESYLAIARMKMHHDTEDIVIPGVLRDFDLPDVIAALGARYVSQ
jgi:dipeptidyl aminopeptidase/acylaminoacyl peptidase